MTASRSTATAVHRQEPRPIRRFEWAIAFAVWTVPAAADVADSFITERLRGTSISLAHAAAVWAPGWYFWALLTPVFLWLGRRFPLGRPLRAEIVVLHLALSVVASVLHALVLLVRSALVEPETLRRGGAVVFGNALADWLPVSIVIYWAILGAGYAVDNFRRYREQELRASELSERLASSELAALRAQLHPHFLFNALNTAASLVRVGDADAGVRVLTQLGDLLREALRNDAKQECPLAQELELVRAYIGIERARFGERLSFDMEVPDELLDCLVPTFVIQPLVENAVRHGVGPRDAPGHVRVSARADHAALELCVADDGPGLRDARGARPSTGVGLSNTRDRLDRLYGSDGSLTLEHPAPGGLSVTVRLPRRESGQPLSAVLEGTTTALVL